AAADVQPPGPADLHGLPDISRVQSPRQKKGAAEIFQQVPVKSFSRAPGPAVQQHQISAAFFGQPEVRLCVHRKGLDHRSVRETPETAQIGFIFLSVKLNGIDDPLPDVCGGRFRLRVYKNAHRRDGGTENFFQFQSLRLLQISAAFRREDETAEIRPQPVEAADLLHSFRSADLNLHPAPPLSSLKVLCRSGLLIRISPMSTPSVPFCSRISTSRRVRTPLSDTYSTPGGISSRSLRE